MSEAPKARNEAERLCALAELKILDTPAEQNFDELVQLASVILQVPISLVTFVDRERQWFKAKTGITTHETPRSSSFCAYSILDNNVLVVEDASQDARFCENPLVTGEPKIRFYAGAPIYSPNGYPLGSLCVIDTVARKISRDQIQALTVLAKQVSKQIELRESTRLLKSAKLEAEKSNEHLKLMIGVIAHDLRNPIGNLSNLSDLLLTEHLEMDAEEVTEFLEHINDASNQTAALLENLLEWSSAVTNLLDYAPEPSYFEHTFLQAESIVRPLIKQKKQTLKLDVARELLLRVDSRMIASVLRNLISNASKFTPPGGLITVRAEQADYHATISITDNGVGMNSTQIARILEDKRGFSTTGTLGEKGTGMGLGLVHHFLKQHNTELTIESAPGKGTTLSFSLPLA